MSRKSFVFPPQAGIVALSRKIKAKVPYKLCPHLSDLKSESHRKRRFKPRVPNGPSKTGLD